MSFCFGKGNVPDLNHLKQMSGGHLLAAGLDGGNTMMIIP